MKDLPACPERAELCPNVLLPVLLSPLLCCLRLPIWVLSSLIRGDSVSGAGAMTLLPQKDTIPWCSHSARITMACFPLRYRSDEITGLLRLLQAPKVK